MKPTHANADSLPRSPEDLLRHQTKILELVALGEPLSHVLDSICRLIEQHVPDTLCSVLLLDEGRWLRHGAAPNLPSAYCQAIDGLEIGPAVGSCGTAAYRGEEVIVDDIATDPLWADYREFALEHGLQACWSTPIRSRDGDVTGTFAVYYREPRRPADADLQIVADATYLAGIAIESARAEEERQRLTAQVQQAEKLESLGDLAGRIAYDFHALLMRILGDAALARVLRTQTPSGRELFESIERAARRALDLTNQLITYSGKGEREVCAVFVNRLIEEGAHLIDAVVAKDVTVEFDLSSNDPLVMADTNQLRQVIMNLVTNASEAMEGRKGSIRVSTGIMDVDRPYLSSTYLVRDIREGSYVYLEVADAGRGMEPEVQARLFDPFFSTKHAEGGLGMASVLGTVRAHNGTIKVESSSGQGTTIRVLLPCPPVTASSSVAQTR